MGGRAENGDMRDGVGPRGVVFDPELRPLGPGEAFPSNVFSMPYVKHYTERMVSSDKDRPCKRMTWPWEGPNSSALPEF